MIGKNCKPNLIACSNACEVWACEDCGTIHLSVGPVSMKLKHNHFMKMVETLGEASRHLNTFHPDIKMQRLMDKEKLHH